MSMHQHAPVSLDPMNSSWKNPTTAKKARCFSYLLKQYVETLIFR